MYAQTNARPKDSQQLPLFVKRLAASVRVVQLYASAAGRHFLAACHESRRAKAAKFIQEHQYLVDQANAWRPESNAQPADRDRMSEIVRLKVSAQG